MLQFCYFHRNFISNTWFCGERAGYAFDRTYEGDGSSRICTHIVFIISPWDWNTLLIPSSQVLAYRHFCHLPSSLDCRQLDLEILAILEHGRCSRPRGSCPPRTSSRKLVDFHCFTF